MLFTTPGLGEHISGVILFDETIRQSTDGRRSLREGPRGRRHRSPGIKVDTGAKPLALFPGETVTEGLDGLRERLAALPRARRAVRQVARHDHHRRRHPHRASRSSRTRTRWRATRRSARRPSIVPIVEPEILMDGDHTIDGVRGGDRAHAARAVRADGAHRVDLAGSLLKVNMVLSGEGNAVQDATPRSPRRRSGAWPSTCPRRCPAIVFLSGGQSTITPRSTSTR